MIERRPLSQPPAADHGSVAFLSDLNQSPAFRLLMVGLNYGHAGRISLNEVTAGSLHSVPPLRAAAGRPQTSCRRRLSGPQDC
jgi:hypothetical protein